MFRFWKKSPAERSEWAGTGFMYEYQGKMNPSKYRNFLEDKTIFYKRYGNYMKHKVADIKEIRNHPELFDFFNGTSSLKVVFKIKDGGCGRKVLVKSIKDFKDNDELMKFMLKNDYDLVEEYIVQHPEMLRLAPLAVNTVRVITQLEKDDNPVILGCRLRIGVNGVVDNLAAGNLAASVDTETGIITGKGVYSDITKPSEEKHPVTGVDIIGFQIPFWSEVINTAKEVAVLNPKNRCVGWDIAISDKGADLIEGNREWCKLVYQLPIGKGLKKELEKYI